MISEEIVCTNLFGAMLVSSDKDIPGESLTEIV